MATGDLAFGKDGFLYIASGDGGSGGDPQNYGQNLQSLLGKILRIDVNNKSKALNYRIPVDNPFVNQKNARGEIYAYGMRNPWRISFDRENGKLWAADVGQNKREEISIIEKGGNYGWNIMEGSLCFKPKNNCNQTNLIKPIFEYEHGPSGASVTGGIVYRGKTINMLQGQYIFADFLDGRIWTLKEQNGIAETTQIAQNIMNITTFGEDEKGEIYLAQGNGTIMMAKPTN